MAFSKAEAIARAAELQPLSPANVVVDAFDLGNKTWVVRSRKIVNGTYMPFEIIEPKQGE